MNNLYILITTWLITINIIGFVAAGTDKYRAVHKKWRTAERTFFAFALLGGGIGVYAGCLVFNHKTRNMKFMIGIPARCIAEAVIALLFIGKYL